MLEKYPRARNSDIELYIKYLQHYACQTEEEMLLIRKILEMWGINIAGLTRVRANIQNDDGKFLSDKKIKKLREAKEEDCREEFSPINNWTRY